MKLQQFGEVLNDEIKQLIRVFRVAKHDLDICRNLESFGQRNMLDLIRIDFDDLVSEEDDEEEALFLVSDATIYLTMNRIGASQASLETSKCIGIDWGFSFAQESQEKENANTKASVNMIGANYQLVYRAKETISKGEEIVVWFTQE